MKTSVQRHAILLAALLQVLPIVRNFLVNPATANAFACILRWGVGAAATIGAYDACSAGSAPIFVTATNYTGTVGVYFTNNIVVTNVPGDSGAFFNLFNSTLTVNALFISNNVVTNVDMPPGLSFKCLDVSGPKYFIGSIYGTPTSPVTNFFVHIQAGYKAETPIDTTNFYTFSIAASSPPVITNQPVGTTNVAGGTVSFTVTAGGTPAPTYQWILNPSTPLASATTATYNFPDLRAAQSGSYSVIITNSAGSITSSPATLLVTNPLPPRTTATTTSGGQFRFTFNGVPGLTNTVLTNANLASPNWGILTNIPPPANNNPITISNVLSQPGLFYRVMVLP